MNSSYIPYGVLSHPSPGQTPRYTDIGQCVNRYGHFCQPNGPLLYSVASRNLEHPDCPEAQTYSNRQMANMRDQMLYGGDGGAYAWQMSMTSEEEMMREWSRCS